MMNGIAQGRAGGVFRAHWRAVCLPLPPFLVFIYVSLHTKQGWNLGASDSHRHKICNFENIQIDEMEHCRAKKSVHNKLMFTHLFHIWPQTLVSIFGI